MATKSKTEGSVVKVGNKLTVVGKPSNVAEYLMAQINLGGKSQADIAKEVGFKMPNMITMLKSNATKLPIDKVGLMAKALNVDPIHLYRMCMAEYYPDTWKVVEGMLEQPIFTANEIEFVKTLRESNVIDPVLRTEEQKAAFFAFVNTLKGSNP